MDQTPDILHRDRLDPRNIELPDPEMIPILRAMTPAQKLASVESMFRHGKWLAEVGARHQHPTWSKEEIRLETLRRLAGVDGR